MYNYKNKHIGADLLNEIIFNFDSKTVRGKQDCFMCKQKQIIDKRMERSE